MSHGQTAVCGAEDDNSLDHIDYFLFQFSSRLCASQYW